LRTPYADRRSSALSTDRPASGLHRGIPGHFLGRGINTQPTLIEGKQPDLRARPLRRVGEFLPAALLARPNSRRASSPRAATSFNSPSPPSTHSSFKIHAANLSRRTCPRRRRARAAPASTRALDYSTFLGANNFRRAFGVAADAGGFAYVTGTNTLRRLSADGSALIPTWTPGGEGRNVALAPQGNIYVAGTTTTTAAYKCTAGNFCPTPGSFQQNPGGSTNDDFVIKFRGDGQPINIAGYTFAADAAVDDVTPLSPNPLAGAQFCSAVNYAGTTTQQRLRDALSDGCPATSTQGEARFETHFVNNRVRNLPGPDLVVFEIGSGTGNEPFSLAVFDPAQNAFTPSITYTPAPTAFFDCANLRINAAAIDLSDFGIAPGASVSRLSFDNLFVPNVLASGAEISDVLALNSAPPNDASAADAGPDQAVGATGATTPVTLDGSASSDPDGDALSYEWKDGDGNVVGSAATVNLSLPLGTHAFTLTVEDPSGASSSDSVTVVVQDTTAPAINLFTPAQGASYTLGQVVLADYDCSDGGSGLATCTGTTPDGAPIDTATVGAKTFNVQATDQAGNASTVTVTYTVGYGVCPLFDQTKAHKPGSTIPIKLRLCDASGNNLSSPDIAVTALGTVRLSDFAPGEVEDSGNANPDDNFRFADDRYTFNLKTTGLTTGTYLLVFKAGNAPTTHSVQFQIK
jgi:hypothetical protein